MVHVAEVAGWCMWLRWPGGACRQGDGVADEGEPRDLNLVMGRFSYTVLEGEIAE